MEQYIRHNKEQKDATLGNSPIWALENASDLEKKPRAVSYYFFEKKAEKLAAAVYLVTGFLSDNEPIKWQIRECGLSILSSITSMRSSQMSDTSHRIKSVTSDIGKIVSFFEIAVTARFISKMNFSILKEEYYSLIRGIEDQKIGAPEEEYSFSKDFFSSFEDERQLSSTEETSGQDSSKGHVKDTKEYPVFNKGQERENIGQGKNITVEGTLKNTREKKLEKSSRREVILQLIKDKGNNAEVSIKDIVGHFSDCGEKTIQRELTALVEQGVLKKTGERRWSRYSL